MMSCKSRSACNTWLDSGRFASILRTQERSDSSFSAIRRRSMLFSVLRLCDPDFAFRKNFLHHQSTRQLKINNIDRARCQLRQLLN